MIVIVVGQAHLALSAGRLGLAVSGPAPTNGRHCGGPLPLPFLCIKGARILTGGRWFFETVVYHLLGLLAF